MLHYGSGNTHHISFLKGVLANLGQRHLARDNYHGNRIHKRRGNTGNSIGCPWTGGHQCCTHFAGGAGKAVRSMHSSLLVTN